MLVLKLLRAPLQKSGKPPPVCSVGSSVITALCGTGALNLKT